MADEFIILDDVQYTKRSWRNRNQIKTSQGLKWLTIPVNKISDPTPINEVMIANQGWGIDHWEKLSRHYSKTKYFNFYADRFQPIFTENKEKRISIINRRFIEEINSVLGIKTKISWSTDYELKNGRNERLINLCKSCEAGKYLSGPAAKAYLDEALFDKEGIQVEWMDYTGYPEYQQLFPPFEHTVTILDLLFNEGPHATNYMKSFKTP